MRKSSFTDDFNYVDLSATDLPASRWGMKWHVICTCCGCIGRGFKRSLHIEGLCITLYFNSNWILLSNTDRQDSAVKQQCWSVKCLFLKRPVNHTIKETNDWMNKMNSLCFKYHNGKCRKEMFWVQVSYGASNQAFRHSLKKEKRTSEAYSPGNDTLLCCDLFFSPPSTPPW